MSKVARTNCNLYYVCLSNMFVLIAEGFIRAGKSLFHFGHVYYAPFLSLPGFGFVAWNSFSIIIIIINFLTLANCTTVLDVPSYHGVLLLQYYDYASYSLDVVHGNHISHWDSHNSLLLFF